MDEINNYKKKSMSASVVSIALDTDLEDTDWTVDGVKSLVWPTADDPAARDSEGMTMLLLAAKHGWGHMVGTLLAAGASMEATDERGYTPACWVSTSAGRDGGPGEGLRRSLAQRNHGIVFDDKWMKRQPRYLHESIEKLDSSPKTEVLDSAAEARRELTGVQDRKV